MKLARNRRVAALATMSVLVLGAGGLAACGGDDDDSESASLCDDAQALQSSVEDLKDVNVVETGTSSLESAVSTVQDDTNTLLEAAQDEFAPELDDLRSALTTLGTAIENIVANGVAPVQEAISGVEEAATNLTDKVQDEKCD